MDKDKALGYTVLYAVLRYFKKEKIVKFLLLVFCLYSVAFYAQGNPIHIPAKVLAKERRLFTLLCDRTPQVRDAIVAQLGKPCDKIRRRELAGIKLLDLAGQGIEKLHRGDLDGLDGLEFFNLEKNKLRGFPEGFFRPALNLKQVYLDNNFFRSLTTPMFEGLQNSLRILSADGNELTIVNLQGFRYLQLVSTSFNEKLRRDHVININGKSNSAICRGAVRQFF